MIDGMRMAILAEYGSGDDFERYVHFMLPEGPDKRRPHVLEVANWNLDGADWRK